MAYQSSHDIRATLRGNNLVIEIVDWLANPITSVSNVDGSTLNRTRFGGRGARPARSAPQFVVTAQATCPSDVAKVLGPFINLDDGKEQHYEAGWKAGELWTVNVAIRQADGSGYLTPVHPVAGIVSQEAPGQPAQVPLTVDAIRAVLIEAGYNVTKPRQPKTKAAPKTKRTRTKRSA